MKELTISDEIMSNIYKQIGSNVKRIRKEKNISQLSLALAINHKAVGTISMAELCINNKHFNIEHLYKISNVLDVDICEFFNSIDDLRNK
ncbi:MAG: helix-turn-helix transcriptional regulator [Campylobacteraceae bacterium]|nr:helix-turn-helix transcriptional regulator [Campylobacteraceae bacterium]